MRRFVRFVTVIAVGLATALARFVGGQPGVVAAAQDPSVPGATVLESLTVDGLVRDALVYVPASRPANAPAPLVVFLHGGGVDMLYAIRGFGIREEAERAGFIALFPNGTASAMGCCRFDNGITPWGDKQPPDDVRFIGQLLDLVVSKYPIDPDRIYSTGISNGAAMSYRLACELSDRFAGVAAVASPYDFSGCTISYPLSVLAIHGTADPTYPYAGGPDPSGTPRPSQSEIVDFWRAFDGCPAEPDTRMLTPVAEERAYGPCRNGTAVRQYTVQEGMHCWPGTELPVQFQNLCTPGGPHLSFQATPLIADFFLSHPRQAGP
jgi:polyhydroxybutyrate depolymerase